MTTIYLVRHCECTANIERRLSGIVDYPITDKGKGQLDGLAERFRSVALDAVHTSPLSRTRATAEAIARYNGAPVTVDERFIEFDFGSIDGEHVKDLPADLYHLWLDEAHAFYAPDGDRIPEFGPRVWQAFLALAQEYKGKTVAVATHGNVIRSIGLRLMHKAEEQLGEVPWSGNTGVHGIRFDEDGNWEYFLKNDTSHVAAEFAGPLERPWR